jgi:AraC-like DNA-binding protein
LQLAPSSHLAGIIRHFLFLHNNHAGTRKFRLFPDGSAGMVFTLNGMLLKTQDPVTVYPGVFIYGQPGHFIDLYATAGTQLMIVLFQPAGLFRWLNIPAFSLNDEVIEASALLTKEQRAVLRRITIENTMARNISLIESIFSNDLVAEKNDQLKIVEHSLQLIRQSNGIVNVSALSAGTGCHQRTLERLYRQYIGLSPRKMFVLNRVHRFIREVKLEQATARFTAGALGAGYYDQAHLNHEFRMLTGITPSVYFREREHLAVNFMSPL